jgi:hypothetical protein
LRTVIVGAAGWALLLAAPAAAVKCPKDSAPIGTVCVDRYEASVWEIPSTSLRKKVEKGTATAAALLAGGAVQRGAQTDDYPGFCPDSGNGCRNQMFAASIPGVVPSRYVTWFQAAAACANSGKRLLTNAEWQVAALGTPDSLPCVLGASAPGPTGTPACVSERGVFDMVGNVSEWVADWTHYSNGCATGLFGTGDLNCLADPSENESPGALVRGGDFEQTEAAGVFTVVTGILDAPRYYVGFRCAR